MPTPQQPSQPNQGHRVYFRKDFDQRVMLFDFLEASYNGGIGYKDAFDAHGAAVLIEHENEFSGKDGPGLFHQMVQGVSSRQQPPKLGRYYRRKRIAAFENHVKPIVDKIASYVLRNVPNRADFVQPEIERLELTKWIEAMVHDGLKFREAWIGWDAAPIPEDRAESLTVADVKAIDPDHAGKPYLLMMDPRRVADAEFDEDDRVVRVVFIETIRFKGSFTQDEKTVTRYKEWTDSEWTIYEKLNGEEGDRSLGTRVKIVGSGRHNFGRCPWVCFRPPFPIEDIAELNRALFNMSSLLDEELYNSTFTQKWITGEKPDNIAGASTGTGNTLVIESPEAQCGVFGAVPGQSQALMDRVNHLREAIYMIVSMESTNTKNVAETAEKKKRDLESLYTMLVQIAKEVEYAENCLLIGMEIIQPDDTKSFTKYDSRFDVNSVAELQQDIEMLAKVPFAPPQLKRKLAKQLAVKMDPFGDHSQYEASIDQLIDASESFLRGVQILKDNEVVTPDMLANLLGVPENHRQEFIDMMNEHTERERQEAENAARAFQQMNLGRDFGRDFGRDEEGDEGGDE